MNILITSAGRRSYLIKYFKEVLRDKGLVFASNSEYTIALQEADDYLISPLIYDDNYVDTLIGFCEDNSISAIISVFDVDLLVLAKAKKYIESHNIKLLLSDEKVVEICNDKWSTYKFLISKNIDSPLTYKSLETVLEALENKTLEYPLIIKPRWGMASLGIYEAQDRDDLFFYYKKCLKVIQGGFLKYESSLTPSEMILFQEKIIGQEYGLDVISDFQSNYVCVLPKSKILMRSGETDLGQTVSPLEFEKLAKNITKNIKHEVIMSVDCFKSNGKLYVIEMNCRISGHYPLSHLAGVNLPKQIIEWLENKKTDLKNFEFEEGLFVTKDLKPVILLK